jgi:anti-sigma factor RsiW
MGRLMEPQMARVEEHLLICEECRLRLAAIDSEIAAIREALKRREESGEE